MHHSTAAELAESAGRFADARAVPGLCGFLFFFGVGGLFCFVFVLFRDGPCPPRWRARPIEEPRHKPLGGGGGGSGISSGGSSSSSSSRLISYVGCPFDIAMPNAHRGLRRPTAAPAILVRVQAWPPPRQCRPREVVTDAFQLQTPRHRRLSRRRWWRGVCSAFYII